MSEQEGPFSSVVANHYNKLKELGLHKRMQNKCLHYFKNSGDVVVCDIGCGKGGDLLKWMKGGIKHLVCVDIAKTSIEQCRDRYNQILNREQGRNQLFSAEFLVADCTKELLANKLSEDLKFDIVSCQFALHYSFESLEQADCMMRNISAKLKLGGYFIGTIPDAYDIIIRKGRNLKYSNEIFCIEFDDFENLPSLFGAKYHFVLDDVVNCPEFLVYFPALDWLAQKYGLKLIEKKRFNKVFLDNSCTPEGHNLLSDMRALEFYSSSMNSLNVFPNKYYKDAEKKVLNLMQHCQNPYITVGTLSKPEWDAARLYLAFTFQKIGDE